jgi:hypothetical protein
VDDAERPPVLAACVMRVVQPRGDAEDDRRRLRTYSIAK